MSGDCGGGDDLCSRLRAGDRQALAELFAAQRERLWRLVDFRLDQRLQGRIDPDDVLQESYLAAAQRIEHYRANPSMSPFVWLRLMVCQTLIDVHRRHLGAQLRDAGREVAIFAGHGTQATSACLAIHLIGRLTSPSQAAVRAEMLDLVEQAIAQMDATDQEVLALRHFEELTNAEVAEVLGIQKQAASMRYMRAVTRLKAILSQVPGFFAEEAGSP
jgi:RNA polymerase sigma-70 factor (ECF subfamily)